MALLDQQLELIKCMQAEGILDDQFSQLLQLQDESNPDFVAEVVQLYFDDSVGKIEKVYQLLSSPSPDYDELDQIVHQFKGSSASLGATYIAQLCIKLREGCQQQNAAACQQLVLQIKEAFVQLKGRLDTYLQLEQQRKQAGG
jgi:histidine-containing phosphotransfer protein